MYDIMSQYNYIHICFENSGKENYDRHILNNNKLSESVCKVLYKNLIGLILNIYKHLSESVCKCGTKIMTQCLILNIIKISL